MLFLLGANIAVLYENLFRYWANVLQWCVFMSELKIPFVNPITKERLQQLFDIISPGPVLILTHDNPDPDALSSGKALAFLFSKAWGIPSRLIYYGLVARAENKTMLNLLTPEWEHGDVLEDLDQYSAIALLDTQPGAGNNRFPERGTPECCHRSPSSNSSGFGAGPLLMFAPRLVRQPVLSTSI